MKTTESMPGASLNALFIGNSFTARNDVPGLIAGLAAAHGLRFGHRLIQAGGASLRQHWNKGEAQRLMREARFDYVVLQEQSTLPVKNAARMHENIRLFDAAIRETGARTALYLTWARQNAPDTQAAITAAYLAIGAELCASVIPVGVAWQNFLQKHPRPILHDKDLSHPTLAGSYLAACVFFAALFGRNPVGTASELKGLAPADIAALQTAAWAATQK
ncbi:MAG: SGNH/GDSL hydrolase family protein [Blastocatellia bacterium]